MRPEFSPLKEATRGVYRRPEISVDEEKGQPKKDLHPDQDRFQMRENAARDAYHRLEASADRKNSRPEKSHLIQDRFQLKTTIGPF